MKDAFKNFSRLEGLTYAPWPHWRNWGWTSNGTGWGNIAIFWIGPVGFAWDTEPDA